MTAEIKKVADPTIIAAYEEQDQNPHDINNISQLEMMQALSQLLICLQKIENLLTGSSVDSLNLLAEQSGLMVDLSKIEQEQNQIAIDKYNDQIDQQAHQSLMQKIFGGIMAGLMIILGTAMMISGVGAGAGAVMIAVGALSLVVTVCPEAIDKAIDFIAGDNPAIAAAIKTTILITATALACLAGPAAGLMMFSTLFTMLNPIEDIAESYIMLTKGVDAEQAKYEMENNQNLKIVIGVANIVCMLVTLVACIAAPAAAANAAKSAAAAEEGAAKSAQSVTNTAVKAGGTASKAATGAETAATGASAAAKTVSSITSTADTAVQDIKTAALTAKNSIKAFKKVIKDSIQAIRAVTNILQFGTSMGNTTVSLLQAKNEIQMGQSQKLFGMLSAAATLHETTNSLISEIVKTEENFMQSLQKNYQHSSQGFINKLFIDEAEFAKQLAQLVG